MTVSFFYILGAATVKYKLFPYPYLVEFKNNNANTLDYSQNIHYNTKTGLFNIYATNKTHIVMLGDSITYRVNWNELLNNVNIIKRGIDQDTTEGFIHRLHYIYQLAPKHVFIMGGINDIDRGRDVSKIFSNYKLIIKSLKRKNITPLVQSTLYTQIESHSEKVSQLNTLLKTYCQESNITYIDLNKKLSKNNLLMENYTADGIHLNANGYTIWRDEIKNIIFKISNSS